jgi:hypothetical protein
VCDLDNYCKLKLLLLNSVQARKGGQARSFYKTAIAKSSKLRQHGLMKRFGEFGSVCFDSSIGETKISCCR